LWGGVECTVNRVDDHYRDQTKLSGHHHRLGDLEAFASIGIRKIRYPVLWERVAPYQAHERDWRWSDERLAEIARLGMTPIVGLLHHGSGPAYTNLLANDFPVLFAEYAAAVAARYPTVVEWTPINEPLTTARFSALYGHWYPHARDQRSFLAALLNQIDGTRLAMRAIRRVNPDAQLIQTEDLGQTYATEDLASVAEHYNDRRWLSWDLLCGRVIRGHPLWDSIAEAGFADRLHAIADDPCEPDVIGLNHYVTSDRFLDRDESRGPLPQSGFHDHVAVRAMDPPPRGLPKLLAQSSARYGIPIAVTECHLGCTRDEQMRWLFECWQACSSARRFGIDVIALTSWALTGSTDWDSLLTQTRGRHETGAFEMDGTTVRPTALARLIEQLQVGGGINSRVDLHPVLASAGWWRRPPRPSASDSLQISPRRFRTARPLLIVGATGTLGRALAGGCQLRGIGHVITDRATMALDNILQIEMILDRYDPWAVINAAGWVRIDAAETESALCYAANEIGAINLSAACDVRDIACMSFSSDQVFDGEKMGGYDETDVPNPLNVYGASKLAAEKACLLFEKSIVIRTAAFFSPYDAHNFAMQVEHALDSGEGFRASDRHVVTPTYVPHLVNACLDLTIDAERGLWHLSSGEILTWLEFARRIAAALQMNGSSLTSAHEALLGWSAKRPLNGGLVSSRGRMLPGLDHALEHYVSQRPSARNRVDLP
jgi:dTDP-4-dehydrorhamnose reductase